MQTFILFMNCSHYCKIAEKYKLFKSLKAFLFLSSTMLRKHVEKKSRSFVGRNLEIEEGTYFTFHFSEYRFICTKLLIPCNSRNKLALIYKIVMCRRQQ